MNKDEIYDFWIKAMDRVMVQWHVYKKNASLVQDRQFEEMLEKQYYYCRKKAYENMPPEVQIFGETKD